MKFLNLALPVLLSLIMYWRAFWLDEFDVPNISVKPSIQSVATRRGKKINLQKEGEKKRKIKRKESVSSMLRSSIIIQLLESIHLAHGQNLPLEAQQEL